MSNCGRCKTVCRCEHEYEICVTAGAQNIVKTKCPIDVRTGCVIDEVTQSLLEVFCPCCSIKMFEFTDPFQLSNCDPCSINIDLTNIDEIILAGVTSANLRLSECKMRYRLSVNGIPYLSGAFMFDWSFF